MSQREKLLVVDDEEDVLDVIEYNLRREGYAVVTLNDGHGCLAAVLEETPDLVLLDVMLPGGSGLDLCRAIKASTRTSSTPVILVSARASEADIEAAFKAGADDYVCKPFRIKELIARVKAVLRRGNGDDARAAAARIARDGFELDTLGHRVYIDGLLVGFTAVEFRLLYLLASHPGKAFTRERIVASVMGYNATASERSIDVHVRAIRKKLASRKNLVETVRGIGYRFQSETPESSFA